MAASSSGVASPTCSSIASLGGLEDEREMDRLASIIPDSQPLPDHAQLKPSPKRFLAGTQQVSPLELGEGFSYAPKESHRPGQYSQRLGPKAPVLSKITPLPEEQNPTPPITQSTSKHKNPSTKVRPTAAPLDLPELGLPAVIASSRSPEIRQHTKSGETSRQLPFDLTTSPASFSPPNLTKPASSSPVSAHNAIHRPSRPHPPELKTNMKPSSVSRPRQTLNQTPPSSYLPTHVGESGSSKYFQVNKQSDRESRFSNLKLLVPNVAQAAQAQAHARDRDRNSPARTCGDLERPLPQTPRTYHPTPRHYASSRSTRKILSPRHQNEKSAVSHDRSISRTSNISRKRSAVNKHRSRTDPERKQMAMHHVAQYWNECMRIAAEEKDEANGEIEALQIEIHKQAKELNMSVQLLSEKKVELQQTEFRCKELEDQENQVRANNQRLNDELQTLRIEISESKNRATNFADKSRTYKSKLNEAIAEQQSLFVRSRDLYNECQEELLKEKSSRAAQALEVDKALEESHKKRDDLKQCFQDFRYMTEQDTNTKVRVIEQLQAKIEEREAQIAREKETANDLRHHINEQTKVCKTVERLGARVQDLVDASLKRQRQGEDNEIAAVEVSSKLDTIMEHLQASADNASPPVDFELIAKGLEENILAKVLPVLLAVMSSQTQAKGSISELRTEVTDELEGIKKVIDEQKTDLSLGQESQSTMRKEISESLESLRDKMEGTQRGCESRIAQMIDRQKNEQQGVVDSLQNKMTQLFEKRELEVTKRETKIQELQQALQRVTDDYAKKATAMGDSILKSNEVTNEKLQSSISAVHLVLEKGFEKEKAEIERGLLQSEQQRKELEAQLEEVRGQLAVASNTLQNTDTSKLRQSLNDERQAVISLRTKLAQFEAAAGQYSQLHDRWLRDIQAIETLREQLKHVTGRLPGVSALGGQLQDMVKMNNTMRVTAEYLNDERHWVQGQLQSRVRSITATVSAPPTVVKPSQSELGDLSSTHVPASSNSELVSTEPGAQQEALLPKNESQGSQANGQRKVLVYSPAVGMGSPSLAMTIQEEQQRRREGITPRSILKSSQSSSQETSTEDLPPKLPSNHSQYNRPVMSQPSSSSTDVTNAIQKQIRDGFLPRHAGLITVADFQKTVEQGEGQAIGTSKRRLSTGLTHTQDTNVKRVKVEESSSQVVNRETLRPRAQALAVERKQKATTSQLSLRAYSRKSSTQ